MSDTNLAYRRLYNNFFIAYMRTHYEAVRAAPLGISALSPWIYNSIRVAPPTALRSGEHLRQRRGSGFKADSYWPAAVPGTGVIPC